MEIGGQDISFETDEPVSIDALKVIISGMWPNAVFETEGEGQLFAYRDEDSKLSWDEYGLTDDNGDALLYVTLDGCQVHLVHDDETLARRFADKL